MPSDDMASRPALSAQATTRSPLATSAAGGAPRRGLGWLFGLRDRRLRGDHDEETGLPNAMSIERRLGRWVRRARRAGRPLAIITVSVLGTDGEAVALEGSELRAVVAALRSCCQRGERLFRTGEGTFTVVAPKVERGGIVRRSEALRACVREVVGPALRERLQVCASVSVVSRAPRRPVWWPAWLDEGVRRTQIA